MSLLAINCWTNRNKFWEYSFSIVERCFEKLLQQHKHTHTPCGKINHESEDVLEALKVKVRAGY